MPLYGTCTTSIAAIALNSSPAKCVPLPTPAEEKLSWPGFAFAITSISFTDFAANDGATTRRYFDVAVCAM